MSAPTMYAFPPPESRAVLGPFTAGQVATGGGLLLLVVFGVIRPNPSPARIALGLLMIVLTAPVVLAPLRGRTILGWTPIMGHVLMGRLSGRTNWRSAAPHRGSQGRMAPLPPGLGRLDFLSHLQTGEALGVLADRRAGTYTAVVEVDCPPFLLEDMATQEEALAHWGLMLARLTHPNSELHRLQWVIRAAPDDGHGPRRYLERARARDLDEASEVIRSYLELLRSPGLPSTRHTTLIAAQISSARSARAIRAAGGGDQGACLVLAQTLRTVNDGLTGFGVEVRRILDMRGYQGLLRAALDPHALGLLDAAASAHPDRGWGSQAPWPYAVEERWGHYRTAEHAWHRSFTLLLPRLEVAADWLVPLILEGDSTQTIALTVKGVPHRQATREVRRAVTRLHAEEQRKDQLGQLHSAEDAKHQDATHRRMRELADGHAEIVYALTATLTAPDLDALDAACRTFERVAGLAGCELRLLEGQQAQGFTWTLPLGRGLA